MGLADKYREKVAKGTSAYRKNVEKQLEAKAALEKEKKEAAERWKKQQAKMAEEALALEQKQLEMWGMAVMATGFADKYPDGFELLDKVLKYALEHIEQFSGEAKSVVEEPVEREDV